MQHRFRWVQQAAPRFQTYSFAEARHQLLLCTFIYCFIF